MWTEREPAWASFGKQNERTVWSQCKFRPIPDLSQCFQRCCTTFRTLTLIRTAASQLGRTPAMRDKAE